MMHSDTPTMESSLLLNVGQASKGRQEVEGLGLGITEG